MSGDGIAAVESAAPAAASTADVATTVIDQLEGTEAAESAEASGDVEIPGAPLEMSAVDTPEPKAEPTPGVIKAPLSPEEELLAELGYKEAFKPDGREHYIPRSKVLKMIGTGLKRGNEKWNTEKTAIEGERNAFRADLDEMYTDLRGEPKAFIEKLSQHDPRYRAFLEPAAPPQPPAPVVDVRMPEPDVQLPDGSRTYSIDGLTKLLEWNTAKVEAKLMPQVEDRLKPYAERDKAEKARIAAEKAASEVRSRIDTIMADAQSWPGFKDHHDAILQVLRDDSAKAKAENRKPTLSLEAAYRQVVVPRLTEDHNKQRERLLKEISASAGKTPAIARGGAETAKAPGHASTAEIAARTIERLERGGA